MSDAMIQPKVGFNPDFMRKVLLGREVQILFPNGEKHKAQYAIADLSDVIASHNEVTFSSSEGYPVDTNKENINDRNYKDDTGAQARVVEFAQNLDAGRLITTSRTSSGTPIASIDGIIVSGNNRTMSLKLAANRFPENYQEYKSLLAEEITAFGFDSHIGTALVMNDSIPASGSSYHAPKYHKFDRPVLIRIDYDFPAYNTLELSKYNKETNKAERPIYKAIKLGKILASSERCTSVIEEVVGKYETFSEFYANGGDRKRLINTLIDCQIINTNELPAYYSETGFTEQGKELIESLLAGLIMSKEALIQSNEGAAKVFRQTIITSLPVLTANNALGEESLIPYLNEAILIQSAMSNSNLSFQDYVSQSNIFGSKPTYQAMVINRLLASGRNKFESSFEGYNQSVIMNRGESLFGEKPSKDEMFQAHIAAKIDPTELMLAKRALESTEQMIPVELQKPKATMNPFIDGNYFKEHPENILATTETATDRWKKTITVYKGSLDNISRIEAAIDYVAATKVDQPIISVSTQPVSKATDTNTTVVDNLQSAISKSGAEVVKKSKKARAMKQEPTMETVHKETYTLNEVYDMINPDITTNDLQAFIYYMNEFGKPIKSPEWIALSGMDETYIYSESNRDRLVRAGALFYYDGAYLPKFLYLSENVYEKHQRIVSTEKIERVFNEETGEESELKTQTGGYDIEFIKDKFGDEVLKNQVRELEQVFRQQYENRLIIQGEGSDEGVYISPVGSFAKEMKVKTLADGKPFAWKLVTASSNNRYGQFDFLAQGVVDRDKRTMDELNLTDAFCYWLRTDDSVSVKKGITYADIIKIYVLAANKPTTSAVKDEDGRYSASELAIKKKEDAAWERLKSKAKEEGERLFKVFLDTQLTTNDKVRIETTWNMRYNSYVPINYNMVPVAFRCNKFDMGKPMVIRPEKREAVAFTLINGSGLLAYDVGVGKTPSAIFTISAFMDLGFCTRPLLIVPNQTYKQWISEFEKFAAHIPINDFYNLSEDYIRDWRDVQGVTKKVPENTVSIITYEGMERLGFTEQTAAEMQPELRSILLQDKSKELTGKKAERAELKNASDVETMVGKALSKTVANIEEFGFDFLSFDEAHAMKKVFTFVRGEAPENTGTSGKQMKVITRFQIQSGKPSYRGVKGFFLSQYVQNKFKGNTLLLTATPFTNSPIEIFSMLSMIAYDKLKEMELENIQNFFETFVNTSFELIINSRLMPERKQIILGFNNLLVLQRLVRRFINYKTGEQVNVPRPNKIVLPYRMKMVDGQMVRLSPEEAIETILPMTDLQNRLMQDVKLYAQGEISEEQLCAMAGVGEDDDEDAITSEGVEIDEDVMTEDEKVGARLLKAMAHARNLALSPYIFDCSGLGEPTFKEYVETSNKLSFVMESIRSIKQYHDAEGSPMSGVVIYMDRGVQYFTLLRQYLIEEIGFADHEVGIISSKTKLPLPRGVKPDEAKEYLKNKFLGKVFNTTTLEMEDLPDSERMKVIIGSSTIKEGINLQSHSSVLFNCWIDWNVTDIQQLEGRIWRQGNKFKTVRIVNPLMIDSMDVFMFQKLEEKTSRINNIWRSEGRKNVLNTEDFNPKELKRMLIKDPETIARLELLEVAEKIDEDISDLHNKIKRNDKIRGYAESIKRLVPQLQEWLEQFRPSEGRSRTPENMLALAQEVVRKKTDAQGRRIFSRWEDADRRRYLEQNPGAEVSPIQEYITKQYYFGEIGDALRQMKRAEREYMAPNGLTVDSLPDYSIKLQKDIDTLKIEQESLAGDEAIKARVSEILEEREANQIRPKSVSQVVDDFKKLNYLLSELKVPAQSVEKTTCPPVDANGVPLTDAESLKLLDECVKHEPETKRMHTVEQMIDGETKLVYTDERKKLHEQIIDDLTKDAVCIQRDQPIAVLTGGSPASGKSTFLKKYAPYLLGDEIYHIDADAIREYLPEYKGWNSGATHQETRDIVAELLDSFDKPCKHDIIYDGTMTNARKYLDLIMRLKQLGYNVFIAFMVIPKEVAIERALSRYKNNKGGKTPVGRYVSIDVIDDFYKTGTGVFDEIKSAVDGYILVNSLTQTIIEQGGERIPENRSYGLMFNGDKPAEAKEGTLSKVDYQASLDGAKVMLSFAATSKEKKDLRDYIAGLKVMIDML